MDRKEFREAVKALATAEKDNPDPMVWKSAAILFTLSGAIAAGDDFFDPLYDAVGTITRNQAEILERMVRGS
jgi:hypothetical protein